MAKIKLKENFKFRAKFVAASAFIALIAFVLLFVYLPEDKRWWSLLAFLLIPLSPIITGLQKITISYSLIVVVVYLVLGFTINWWHPGWVLFLTIPIFYIFFPHGLRKSFVRVEDEKEATNEDKNNKDVVDL